MVVGGRRAYLSNVVSSLRYSTDVDRSVGVQFWVPLW